MTTQENHESFPAHIRERIAAAVTDTEREIIKRKHWLEEAQSTGDQERVNTLMTELASLGR